MSMPAEQNVAYAFASGQFHSGIDCAPLARYDNQENHDGANRQHKAGGFAVFLPGCAEQARRSHTERWFEQCKQSIATLEGCAQSIIPM
jgi:hypothetical protein